LIRLCGLCILCGLSAPLVAFPSSPNGPRRFEFSEPHMGTQVRVVLYAPDAALARAAAAQAFARIAALDSVMSDYRDDSELMALCRRAGRGPVAVSDDLFRVLQQADRVSRASHGAFDVTVGPLTRLWRRARRVGELPDPAQVRAALMLVGFDKLTLDESTRSVTLGASGMQIDLGGIGKGFAADEAAATLIGAGIRSALVAVGGDIVATDPPPDARGWTVAIAGMSAEKGASPRAFLYHMAISTSGDAEQWLERDGIRHSHIIDPRTGGAVTGHSSVTIVAERGVVADALATAVSVLGPAGGLRLVDETPGAAALIASAGPHGVRRSTSSRWSELARLAPL
jgi:thiamine biosynthesis lipoprotein